jgi:hypothetical protein
MATDSESFNRDLYDLLKVRGYNPVPLDSKNQRVSASQDSDVIEFQFSKDGEDYGKVWATVDDAQNLTVYYGSEQQESPSTSTPGVDYDDTWTGLLKFLKTWAQRRQMSFELANKDRVGDDMRQRDYFKMKEKLGEGYHSMGKKASYNDAVPNVKIVLQHNRALEEGEQRYRNIARIYLENVDGERFLAPTNRPGIARVYARHIAEGGVPNDDRWNHIKSICEDYNKMAGFVRATRNGQFNESAQELVTEGVNHYNNLRETLHKMTGHRGYQAYFESWTPALMENEGDESINELFVQETMDPRIESAMPILSRLRKPVAEMSEVDTLAEWADTIISEKLDMDSTTKTMAVPADEMLDEAPGAETLAHNQSTEKSNLKAFDLEEMDKSPEANPYSGQGHRKGDDNASRGPDKTAKMMAAKDAVKAARKALDKAFNKEVDENFISMAPQAVAEEEVEEGIIDTIKTGVKAFNRSGEANKRKWQELGQAMRAKTPDDARRHSKASDRYLSVADGKGPFGKGPLKKAEEVEEGLDANQKRVGQLGPTEKVKNNNIGKLVGANESTEIPEELARIMEMARFKR